MRIVDLTIKTDIELDEGLKSMVTDLFFLTADKPIPTKAVKPKIEDEEPSEPFGGVCKFKNSILIPETNEYRINDSKLISAAAQMFRGNWVNNPDAQNCLKSVLSHLLKKYLEGYNNNVSTLDMNVLADSIADGKLNYSNDNDDYRVVQRVYKRITMHKDRIFDDMIKNPGNFRTKWVQAKTELSTVIENVLITGGDPSSLMGRLSAENADKNK